MIIATFFALRVFINNSTEFPPDSSLLQKPTSIQSPSPVFLQPLHDFSPDASKFRINDEVSEKTGKV